MPRGTRKISVDQEYLANHGISFVFLSVVEVASGRSTQIECSSSRNCAQVRTRKRSRAEEEGSIASDSQLGCVSRHLSQPYQISQESYGGLRPNQGRAEETKPASLSILEP